MTPYYILRVAQRQAERMGLNNSHVNDIQWCEGYADGSEAPKGVMVGNWNDDDTYNERLRCRDKTSNLPSRLCRIFEKLGIEIEWSDMVGTCDDCGLLIQTKPTGYDWQPEFVVGDGEITCAKCIENNATEHLEGLESDPDRCNTISNIDPEEYGYVLVNEESFESGWHHLHQTDDPHKVAKELTEKGISRFLFQLDEYSQFYIKWSVYVHTDETDLLGKKEDDSDDGVDE